jgi:single-strand DNA-binding protein
MNLYHFSGNLGADPTLRYTPAGKAVTSFNVGVSTGFGDNRKTVWVRCQVWEKRAELVAEAFHKGSRFSGCGEIVGDRWEKEGKENPQIEVRVVEFDLPPKGESSTGSAQRQDKKPSEQSKPDAFDDFNDDPLPF